MYGSTQITYIGGIAYSFGSTHVDPEYPWHYGIGCEVHDIGLSHLCETQDCGSPLNASMCVVYSSQICLPSWCTARWCWVNESACTGIPPASRSSYFPLTGLHYSYETCSASNDFLPAYMTEIAPRPPPSPPPNPTRPPPSSPPPQLPPAAPPSAPPQSFHVEIGLGAGAGSALFLCFAALVAWLYRTRSHLKAQRRANQFEEARKAIEATQRLSYPACFIRASDFVAMGRLRSHEDMRDAGLLVHRDSFEELSQGHAHAHAHAHAMHSTCCCSSSWHAHAHANACTCTDVHMRRCAHAPTCMFTRLGKMP